MCDLQELYVLETCVYSCVLSIFFLASPPKIKGITSEQGFPLLDFELSQLSTSSDVSVGRVETTCPPEPDVCGDLSCSLEN